MNRRIGVVLAAAAVVTGVVATVLPQHAASAARVGATTVAVVVAALVTGAVSAVAGRPVPDGPLDRTPGPLVAPLDPHGLRDARRDLGRPGAAGSVPPVVLDRLVAARPRRCGPLPEDVALLLSSPRPHGDRRDPSAVAAVVHRVLDSYDLRSTS